MLTPQEMDAVLNCGATKAGERLVVGDEPVTFSEAPTELGRDGFSINRRDGKAEIEASTQIARTAAVQELVDMQAAGQAELTRKLRFGTRIYKLEFQMDVDRPLSILDIDDEYWNAICQRLVRQHFNGLVLYLTHHPFEGLLDYDEFPEATTASAGTRRLLREKMRRMFAICHGYGIRTFIQHYLTYYPTRFSMAHGLPFREEPPKDGSVPHYGQGMALKNSYHPAIWDYSKYIYRRLFELVPELDGLYMNYEQAPNCADFVKEVVLPTLNALEKKPVLFHRLWCMTSASGLCDIIEQYSGESIVGHKISESTDSYVYPVADSRISEWKAKFEKRGLDVEFCYLLGPCHNCATNISTNIWSDPEFVYTILQSAADQGTDGISFHSIINLLEAQLEPETSRFPDLREHAKLVQFHLSSAVDFVRGGSFDEERIIAMHADHFGLDPRQARTVYEVLRDSSRAIIQFMLQFPITAREGYSVDADRLLAQHPFFHLPVNELFNDLHLQDKRHLWCWLNKRLPSRPYPDDFENLIDYVDPEKPKTERNPDVLSREIMELGSTALEKAQSVAAVMGDLFASAISHNRYRATCCYHDMQAALSLYRLYFAEDIEGARAGVQQALHEYREYQNQIDKNGNVGLLMRHGPDPKPGIEALERLQTHLNGDVEFGAFRTYARSKKTYNDIRRCVRPWRAYSEASISKARELLEEAHGIAEGALQAVKGAPNEEHVRHWAKWLEHELDCINPPGFICGESRSEWQPMVHDNCFGYGSFGWQDFLSFFERADYDKGLDVKCAVGTNGESLSVYVREDGVQDMEARKAHWARFEFTGDQVFFIRLLVDCTGQGRELKFLEITPEGKMAFITDYEIDEDEVIVPWHHRIADEVDTNFSSDANSWEIEIKVPFSLLGHKPGKGDKWLLNIAGATALLPNHSTAWCKSYELGPGNRSRMGTLVFGL